MPYFTIIDDKLAEFPFYQSENINKPAKPYNPDLLTGRPLWEEQVNDLTGRSAGWLSLFHIEGSDQFLVQYCDLAKRRAIDDAVDAKAEKAKALATEKFAEFGYLTALTVEVEGTTFDAYRSGWECSHDNEVHINAYPHYANPEDWIYDLTDNKLGKFIIAGWKALNPEAFAALPKTAEELEQQRRESAAEETAALDSGNTVELRA